MTELVNFVSATPHHQLPYLISGQAQKEMFINEAFARLDALLHPQIKGTSTAPPAMPVAGECWIVGADAIEAWLGRDDHLASWDGGQWTFVPPFAGLRAFDLSAGRYRTFSTAWDAAPVPVAPSSGMVVDAEARDTLATILAVLREHRIIAAG
ncbi:DUF2793 domain-containing protein [Erythrobacter sp.]|uniref:DUF2793 domain-containing protein n=1 Tax=Erythrobacter sp. TaxID=1042 RepID=UPI00311F58C4